MGFNERISGANATAIARFANCTATVNLYGVPTRLFRGVLDLESQMASPFEGGHLASKPAITAGTSELTDLPNGTSLDILRDGEAVSKEYSPDGKARPDGAGLHLLYLTVKKP